MFLVLRLCICGVCVRVVFDMPVYVICVQVALELWLHGNVYLGDYMCRESVDLLERSNHVISIYR